MSATLIDGKAIAAAVRQEVADEVAAIKAQTGNVPTLAVVLVGENPASQTYVSSKGKACIEAGMGSITKRLPATATQQEVEELVRALNADPDVNGILVQLPLPKGLNEKSVLDLISINKDVDGFHPMNIGELVMKGRTPQFIPCTPAGCIELLIRSGIEISGKDAVVVGRSNIVGKPIAPLMLREHATVTVAHSRTADLPAVCREADILIVAIGKAKMITADFVKPGAVVIDVGINRNEAGKVVGDVDFSSVEPVASAITPVPGGVGLMTVAMLLQNTLDAFCRIEGIRL